MPCARQGAMYGPVAQHPSRLQGSMGLSRNCPSICGDCERGLDPFEPMIARASPSAIELRQFHPGPLRRATTNANLSYSIVEVRGPSWTDRASFCEDIPTALQCALAVTGFDLVCADERARESIFDSNASISPRGRGAVGRSADIFFSAVGGC